LIMHTAAGGDFRLGSGAQADRAMAERICEILQMIAATREFQMA